MHPNTRACIAYIAARIVNGKEYSFVFDEAHGKRISITGGVAGGLVAIFDHDRGCLIHGDTVLLRDEGQGCSISFELNGNYFLGVDDSDETSFSGHVDGEAIVVYDSRESTSFSYSV
jgi:hypothetical protein